MPTFLEEAEQYQNELYHHGVDGQRWGIRRYQYKDGSLTPEGRAHWGIGDGIKGVKKFIDKKKASYIRQKKNAIIARADVKELEKKKHLLTEKELAKAYRRAGVVQAIKGLDPDKISEQEERAAKLEEYRARTERGHIIAQDIINSGAALASIGTTMAQGYFALRTIKAMLGGGSTNHSGPTPANPPTPSTNPSNPPTPSTNPPSNPSGPVTYEVNSHTPTASPSVISTTSTGWNNSSTLDAITTTISDMGTVNLSDLWYSNSGPTPSTFNLQDLQDYEPYD